MIKITHLTSAHPRYDTRIYIKECMSLSKVENYDVSLVVADGRGDEKKGTVSIYDVGKIEGRFNRIFMTTRKVLKKAMELESDVYHLHDPELMPMGLKLKKMGKKVIFDAHEDLPKQIMAKHYLGRFSKRILSFVASKAERSFLKRFDFVVSATPVISNKFLNNGIESIDINNFPILDELMDIKPNFQTNTICYIGLLYETRGIKEIVRAIENLDVKLIIAGKFFDKAYEQEIKSLKGWEKVDFRGFANRDEVKNILQESIAGLVTLHPTPSYVEANPVKMFEYMSAGLAVVASDFPLYKQFIEGNYCGTCVNPLDIQAIEASIERLIKHKENACLLGNNGKKAVIEKYNWAQEEKKLFKVYEEII